MTLTIVFAFLPKLVKSFGYSEVETGYKVGMIASCIFISRMPLSIVWGYCADRYGRKNLAIIATTCLSITTLAFGFSDNITLALITRLLQGASFGVVVMVKALAFNVSDDTNSSLAMSIIIGGYSFGMIAGPVIGGYLAFPCDLYPSTFSKETIFNKFPILLPQAIIAMGLFIGIIAIVVYIPKDKQDESKLKLEENLGEFNIQTIDCKDDNEKTYLLETQIRKDDFTTRLYQIKIVKSNNVLLQSKTSKFNFRKSSFGRLVLNKSCIMAIICYTAYAFISFAITEMYPLLAAAAKDYNGYGFTPSEIGTSLMATSIIVLIFQFTFMSRIIQYLGLIKCFRYCCFVKILILPILPLSQCIENKYLFWFVMMAALASLRIITSLAILCVNVIVNNSIESDLLGFANGFTLTVSTMGSGIAVGSIGSIFGWSLSNVKHVNVNKHPLGFPFDQYFTFFIIATVSFGIGIYTYILPKTLNKKVIINTE